VEIFQEEIDQGAAGLRRAWVLELVDVRNLRLGRKRTGQFLSSWWSEALSQKSGVLWHIAGLREGGLLTRGENTSPRRALRSDLR